MKKTLITVVLLLTSTFFAYAANKERKIASNYEPLHTGKATLVEARPDINYFRFRFTNHGKSNYYKMCEKIPGEYKAAMMQVAIASYTNNLDIEIYTKKISTTESDDPDDNFCVSGLSLGFKN